MNRVVFSLFLLVVTAAPAAAQYRGPRSADYLFGPSAWGARALWVNPAAQGAVDEASLMLEGVVTRNPVGDYPLSQYTIGFNSRGFGFAFRRDFFDIDLGLGEDSLGTTAGNTWRFGFGRALGPMAIGAGASFYSGPKTRQAVDIGFIYRLQPNLGLAFLLENIGQPVVRDSALRFGGRAGISWTGVGGVLGVDLEAAGYDKELSSGILMGYRGGLRIQTHGQLAFALTGVLELQDDFDLGRLLVGLSIGRDYIGNVVGGGTLTGGENRLTDVSVLGLASRRFR